MPCRASSARTHPSGFRPVIPARCGARSSPGGRTPEELGRYLQTTEQGWGQGVALPFLAPTTAGDQSFKRWFA